MIALSHVELGVDQSDGKLLTGRVIFKNTFSEQEIVFELPTAKQSPHNLEGLIYDTGANLTTLPFSVAQEIGLDYEGADWEVVDCVGGSALIYRPSQNMEVRFLDGEREVIAEVAPSVLYKCAPYITIGTEEIRKFKREGRKLFANPFNREIADLWLPIKSQVRIEEDNEDYIIRIPKNYLPGSQNSLPIKLNFDFPMNVILLGSDIKPYVTAVINDGHLVLTQL